MNTLTSSNPHPADPPTVRAEIILPLFSRQGQKPLPPEQGAAYIALIDACLSLPSDAISDRELASLVKKRGADISANSVRNYLVRLARLDNLGPLREASGEGRVSRFTPGYRDRLTAIRALLTGAN